MTWLAARGGVATTSTATPWSTPWRRVSPPPHVTQPNTGARAGLHARRAAAGAVAGRCVHDRNPKPHTENPPSQQRQQPRPRRRRGESINAAAGTSRDCLSASHPLAAVAAVSTWPSSSGWAPPQGGRKGWDLIRLFRLRISWALHQHHFINKREKILLLVQKLLSQKSVITNILCWPYLGTGHILESQHFFMKTPE